MKFSKRVIVGFVSMCLLITVIQYLNIGRIVYAASNPYPTSQDMDKDGNYEVPCTRFAWQQVYDNLGIALPDWGDAVNWWQSAKNAGYPTGSSPKANSIAVWSGDERGHVAYVTSGSGSTFTVNEGGRTDEDHTSSHGVVYGYTITNAVGGSKPYDVNKILLGFIYFDGSSAIPGTKVTTDDFYACIIRPDKWIKVDSSASDNNNVQLTTGSQTDASCIWRFEKQANGTYVIYNQRNGYVLDAYGAGTSNGTNVYTYKEYVGGKNQQWVLYDTGSGTVIKNNNCDLVLDCKGGNSTAGTNIQLHEYNGTQAQRFNVYVIAKRWNPSSYDPFAYLMRQSPKMNLENSSSGNVQISSSGNDAKDPKQIWWFNKLSDGGFYVANAYNKGGSVNAYLTAASGNSNGANVSTSQFTESTNQTWYIYKLQQDYGSGYVLRAKGREQVLSCNGDASAAGTNINLNSFSLLQGQKFEIYSLSNDNRTYSRPANPNAPTLTAPSSAVAGTNISLSWTSSPLKNDYDARSYRVEVIDSSNKVVKQITTSSLSATITIDSAGTYSIQVRAINIKYPGDSISSVSAKKSIVVSKNQEDPNTGVALNSTNFPDSAFRKYLSDNYDTNNTGYLSAETISSITDLYIANMSISSLKGIEFFTSLTDLSAQDNNISSIDISNNVNLTSVNLSNNSISNINLLNNTNLVFLNIAGNKLSSIDLSKNVKLGTLWLANNQLTSLDVSKNPNLQDLTIHNNKIDSINLNGVTNLHCFYCYGNPFKIIDLRNMTYLLPAYEQGNKSELDYGIRYYKGQLTYILYIDKDDVVITGNETFSVTLDTIANGEVKLSKTSANYGDEITVTATPATGYVLDAIKVNGNAISGNKFTMPAQNTTVAVTFKKVSYTVTLSSVSNGTASLSKTSAYYGDEITVTASPAAGYVLDAIKVNGTAITGTKFTMPAKNTTVAVTFKKATYTVTLSTVTNGTASLSKTSANVGDEITITVSPASGFELDYIKVNGTAISDKKFTMPAKNTNVEVAFKEKVHTLTKVEAKPATCSEEGNNTYYVCKDTECGCKKIYSDAAGQNEINLADTVVPATGHSLEKVVAKEAKCTEKGHLAYWKCTKCGKMFKDSEGKVEITSENIEVDALGHDKDNLKHVEAKKETYKNDGNIEHYICPRCGKKFADPDCKKELTDAEIIIPKKGAAELDETAVVDGLKYKVTNPSTDGTGTVTLTGVDEKKASVVIPGTVEIKESTYIVDRIAAKAFYKDLTLKTVVIGANIRFIDSCAFYGCKNLVKVSGGGKVETIAASVFAYCSKLKTFVITSPALRLIGSGAFNKDKKLKTIYIKNTVKLTKAGVKKSLKGSSVKKVKVKKSKVKAYKKIFKKKNSGRSVKVKK